MSRVDFAKEMALVKEKMPAAEVEKLLGKPDDIRTNEDVGGPTPNDLREIWCYGTNAHMGFGTLGCVYIDRKGRVRGVFGGTGVPIDPKILPEPQLEDVLRLIDTTPGLTHDFDTLRLIRIVNTLQALGKEKALAAIDEYLRVAPLYGWCPARDGLFIVLRALFEIPADTGFMPPMAVGALTPPPPKDPLVCPRYPLVLVHDVPLVLTVSCMLFGSAQPVSQHVQYFREHGTMRALPLEPPDDPLAVFGPLVKSPQWLFRDCQKSTELWVGHPSRTSFSASYRRSIGRRPMPSRR